MRGLRTQATESKAFLRFFELVQEAANDLESVFFLDTGDCKDIPYKDMELDDLFGWLVPRDKASSFERAFLNEMHPSEGDEFLIWCIPTIEDDGSLKIKFKNF